MRRLIFIITIIFNLNILYAQETVKNIKAGSFGITAGIDGIGFALHITSNLFVKPSFSFQKKIGDNSNSKFSTNLEIDYYNYLSDNTILYLGPLFEYNYNDYDKSEKNYDYKTGINIGIQYMGAHNIGIFADIGIKAGFYDYEIFKKTGYSSNDVSTDTNLGIIYYFN